MFFSDILDVHSSCQPKGSHADILGDGFLIQANPIYRNIKAFAVEIGCKYVEAYLDYLLMPFHELPNLVQRKEIPFVPSARLMKKVEHDRPGIFSTEDVPIPESYHLHESSHVIAEHFLASVSLKTSEDKILRTLLAESFANTVDALVCTYGTDEIHGFFVKQNSYMHPQAKVIRAMNELTRAMGFQFTFMLTFFTYLRANFLVSPLSKKSAQELIQNHAGTQKTTPALQKHIQTVCGIGEKLDPLFRYKTTANYFKQQGFEGDVEDLLDFPFMKIFEGRPEWRKAVESLMGVVAPNSL